MTPDELQTLVEDAVLDFTLGDNPAAVEKLNRVIAADEGHFAAWHALTEIRYSEKDFEGAREAADKAAAIDPDDIHIQTSLSRIWLELGSKEKAEEHGARARMLSWKSQLKESSPPKPDAGPSA
jgi:tetratricopeptide (TPR) repeat protein